MYKKEKNYLIPEIINNKNKLENRTHWRNLRNLVKKLAKIKKINLKDYDLFDIKCEEIFGLEFQGNNVFTNKKNDASLFPMDNKFEIFEIPKRNNKIKSQGNFLVLAYNISFNYWIFCFLDIKSNKKEIIQKKFFSEKVYFSLLGYFNNIQLSKGINFKELYFEDILGSRNSKKNSFDYLEKRKKIFNTSEKELFQQITKINKKEKKIVEKKDKVKIYKKRFIKME